MKPLNILLNWTSDAIIRYKNLIRLTPYNDHRKTNLECFSIFRDKINGLITASEPIVSWHKITKENFTELLCEWDTDMVKDYGITNNQKYFLDNDKFIFLSKDYKITEDVYVYFDDNGNFNCEHCLECDTNLIDIHYALKSEFNTILPGPAQ